MALSLGDCQTKDRQTGVNAALYVGSVDKPIKTNGFHTSMRGAGGLVPGGGGLLAVAAAVG